MATAKQLIEIEKQIGEGKFTQGQAIWNRGWMWQNMSDKEKEKYNKIKESKE